MKKVRLPAETCVVRKKRTNHITNLKWNLFMYFTNLNNERNMEYSKIKSQELFTSLNPLVLVSSHRSVNQDELFASDVRGWNFVTPTTRKIFQQLHVQQTLVNFLNKARPFLESQGNKNRPLNFYRLRLTLCTTSDGIQKFCVLPTMHLCVLCGSQSKQRLFLHTTLTDWFL
jgi:hypothetical protein